MNSGRTGKGRNRRAWVNLALTLGFAVFLGSITIEPLRMAAVASFLLFSAIGVALVAMFKRERAFQPAFTRWDMAVLLYLISMFLNQYVDQEAVKAFIEAARDSGLGN